MVVKFFFVSLTLPFRHPWSSTTVAPSFRSHSQLLCMGKGREVPCTLATHTLTACLSAIAACLSSVASFRPRCRSPACRSDALATHPRSTAKHIERPLPPVIVPMSSLIAGYHRRWSSLDDVNSNFQKDLELQSLDARC